MESAALIPHSLQIIGTVCFAAAVVHTFLVSQFQNLARRFPEGSPGENFFHLLGEVEVSFGFWAGIFIILVMLMQGTQSAIDYLDSRNFTEAAFVFVIMAVCSTQPILRFAQGSIGLIARILPLPRLSAIYVTTLTIGPLLGSFITEPAAMTVTALMLLDLFYKHQLSNKFKYATLGLLFVNVSIGGTLTPYAAPPVLMVASKWNWDLHFMLSHFGWKAAFSSIVSASLSAWFFRRELASVPQLNSSSAKTSRLPVWVIVIHLLLLGLIVAGHRNTTLFFGVFLFFLGLYSVTKEYQNELRLREGLLVAFFLAGIVVLGEPQRWWLEPLLSDLAPLTLFSGSIALTSITDNAALAYLGSQIPSLNEVSRYALVAGSVVGGGLTVIANAPNPVGFGLLNPAFGDDGISPVKLALAAAPFTVIAAISFWLL